MRTSVLVTTCAASVGVAMAVAFLPAAAEGLDRAGCAANADRRPRAVLSGRGRIDLAWMAEPEHFSGRAGPYVVRIAAADGPRSLVVHDRLLLPGTPSDWIAAARGADLVLCSRHVPAAVVVARQFCSASLSVGEIVNGEVEEITFLAGVTWLADDLYGQAGGAMPAELAEDLRHDVAMASSDGHIRDRAAPQVVVYAPQVARAVAAWTLVPMSGVLAQDAGARAACRLRHADLRRGIVPARRGTP